MNKDSIIQLYQMKLTEVREAAIHAATEGELRELGSALLVENATIIRSYADRIGSMVYSLPTWELGDLGQAWIRHRREGWMQHSLFVRTEDIQGAQAGSLELFGIMSALSRQKTFFDLADRAIGLQMPVDEIESKLSDQAQLLRHYKGMVKAGSETTDYVYRGLLAEYKFTPFANPFSIN